LDINPDNGNAINNKPISEQPEYDGVNYRVKLIIEQIERARVDITGNYNDWIKIGAAFAKEFGECGRGLFHRVSCFHHKYDTHKTDKKYDSCLKFRKISIASFFYIVKNYGVEI
jgi:hypothetical protein